MFTEFKEVNVKLKSKSWEAANSGLREGIRRPEKSSGEKVRN